MSTGYVFLAIAIVGYGLLGIFHKLADHPSCRPKLIAIILLFFGAVLSTLYTGTLDKVGLTFPTTLIWIGLLGGVFSSLALASFQTGLKFGKISTSWLVLNLSMSIPIMLSIVAYGEKLTIAKGVGLLMVLIAILALWWDKKKELTVTGVEHHPSAITVASKWLPLMLLAFFANGLAASSQKVLVERGFGEMSWQYLVVLYWAGFSFLMLLSLKDRALPHVREWVVGFAMALASVTANVSLVFALDRHVPGSVAYPIGNGGSLFLVVLAGVLFFREHLSRFGVAGILLGISAIVVLTMA